MDLDSHIEKLFKDSWCGDHVLSSLDNMKAQLRKTLENQQDGYWSGSTAYHIAVHGGFLHDAKRGTEKKLTALGEAFLTKG